MQTPHPVLDTTGYTLDNDVEDLFYELNELEREKLERRLAEKTEELEEMCEQHAEVTSRLEFEIEREADWLDRYRQRWSNTREKEEQIKDRLNALYADRPEENGRFRREKRALKDDTREINEWLEELGTTEDVFEKYLAG